MLIFNIKQSEGNKTSSGTQIFLDLRQMDKEGERSWRNLVELAVKALRIEPEVSSFSTIPPDDGSDFTFISDSVTFSRKLLINASKLYIQPRTAPRYVDAFFHCESLARRVLPFTDRAARRVTLISSVFRGDEYLDGFFSSMSALYRYAECEHLLIRAGSPGSEHVSLVEHVRRYPGAVYVNLANDPGLYEVWNLGIRLATGRYLSNANIDDRRAPEQISKLQAQLDAAPEISVASAPLRVSTQKNLPWADSDDCPLMFADTTEQIYAASSLIKHSHEGLASRNLPHCMPLWRRHLHVFSGGFDEKKYGPSADWAFWLRVGRKGAKFYFSNEPLGLYLRDEGTYWRRNKDNARFDDRIAAEFGDLATGGLEDGLHKRQVEQPLSLELSSAIEALRHGAMLDGIGRLLSVAAGTAELSVAASNLIEKICHRFFGCTNGLEWVSRFRHGAGMEELPETALFNALADLIHGFDPLALGDSAVVVRRNLAMACSDWHECFSDGRGLILLALLARRCGQNALEQRLLQDQHAANRVRFWAVVQAAYRFTRSTPELCAALSEIISKNTLRGEKRDYHVRFYPDYSRGNSYQTLLYKDLVDAGAIVTGTSDFQKFLGTDFIEGMENILHIHWLNQIFGQTKFSRDHIIFQSENFLDGIKKAKKKGFSIYWTIHNHASHDSPYFLDEQRFSQQLYKLADKIFMHHPLVSDLVDWVPDQSKLHLCEHGHYDFAQALASSRTAARVSLGFTEQDLIVTHVGKIRDYKELVAFLPILTDQLELTPCMKLVIAGAVTSAETKSWLAAYRHPRLIVKDAFLSEEELVLHMRAADLGFLSYSSILTSGGLVHWQTCGRPVLAPSMGTIPAYLIDGWNGVSYQDKDSLRKRLAYCAALPMEELRRMGRNAQTVARQLDWRLWKS